MNDLDIMIEKINKNELLTVKEIYTICIFIKDIFINEANILYIEGPICVVGNIMGHYENLIHIIELGGDIPETKYLFWGNVVNRGYESINCLLLIILLKIKFPKNIYIIRGKNETRSISQMYGFYDEIQKKYGNNKIWYYFIEVFEYFPLAAIINDNIFCISGGITKKLDNINKIKEINRLNDIKHKNILDELYFSEPIENIKEYKKSDSYENIFLASFFNKFMFHNKFELMLRSSCFIETGYKTFFNQKIYSLWSCSNFINKFTNDGAFMELTADIKSNELIIFNLSQENDDNEKNNSFSSEGSKYI